MRTKPLFALLTGALFLSGCHSTPPGPVTDACSVLTPDEISAVGPRTHRPGKPHPRIVHGHVRVAPKQDLRRHRREARAQLHLARQLQKRKSRDELSPPQDHRDPGQRHRRRGLLRNHPVRHQPLCKKGEHRDQFHHTRQRFLHGPTHGERKKPGPRSRRPPVTTFLDSCMRTQCVGIRPRVNRGTFPFTPNGYATALPSAYRGDLCPSERLF
jgi:hypothetical protein